MEESLEEHKTLRDEFDLVKMYCNINNKPNSKDKGFLKHLFLCIIVA